MPAARPYTQLAVRDTKAAAMLDLTATEFRQLVEVGAVPPPVKIGSANRWRVEDLRAILDGTAARPVEDFDL